MTTLMEWEEPQSVIDFEWQSKYAPQIKGLQRTGIASTLILGVPLIWATLHWAPSAIGYTLFGLAGAGLFFPFSLSSQLWPYKFGRRCQIGGKKLYKSYGSLKFSGYDGKPFKWSEVQKYEFCDHPKLPHVRCLVFSLKGYKQAVVFNFSPEEINEQQLQAILREYLPS